MIFISTSSLLNHSCAVETIKRLAQAGIKNIELGADHEYPVDIDNIIKLKNDFNLRYIAHAFFPPQKEKLMMNIGSANKDTLKKSIKTAKDAIEFCNKAEAEIYSLHSGIVNDIDSRGNPLTKPITKDECINIMKNSLIDIADYANNYGIKLALENHTTYTNLSLFTKPTEIAELIKETKLKNVWLLVDIGHLNITAIKQGFDKKQEIEKIKDKILEFHISENNGAKDEHRPLTDTHMIDFIPKELLKKKIATLEGFNSFSIEDIKKNMKIIEEYCA